MTNKPNLQERLPGLIKQAGLAGEKLPLDSLARVRGRIMQRLAEVETVGDSARFFSWRARVWHLARYAVSVLVGASLVGGTAFASTIAQPGDLLYPIKRVQEKALLVITVSEQKKAELRTHFAEERLEELSRLDAESGLRQGEGKSPSATSSPAQQEQDKEPREKFKAEVRSQATVEVRNALTELVRVKKKLEEKGNLKAVEAVGRNISRLQEGAEKKHLDIDLPKEGQDQGINEGIKPEVKAENTTVPGFRAGQDSPKSGEREKESGRRGR